MNRRVHSVRMYARVKQYSIRIYPLVELEGGQTGQTAMTLVLHGSRHGLRHGQHSNPQGTTSVDTRCRQADVLLSGLSSTRCRSEQMTRYETSDKTRMMFLLRCPLDPHGTLSRYVCHDRWQKCWFCRLACSLSKWMDARFNVMNQIQWLSVETCMELSAIMRWVTIMKAFASTRSIVKSRSSTIDAPFVYNVSQRNEKGTFDRIETIPCHGEAYETKCEDCHLH